MDNVPVIDGTKGDRSYSLGQRKPSRIPRPVVKDNGENEKQEFRHILEEVQKLGASNLSWKERKEYESKKLSALGAKPMKTCKMPIVMGLSIKRKRERLEAEKLEQDILAGVLPKKRRERTPYRENSDSRGLRLPEGKFKGGVLYVQKPELKGSSEGKGRKDRTLDRVFSERKGRGGGKSKKGKGKKGGKKKGGKRKH